MFSGRFFIILFAIMLTMPTYAQRRGVDITGTVIEGGTNEPIEQATVRLLNAKDSTMVGGVATGRNGSFTLKNIKNGNYVLNISFIGFETLYKAIQVQPNAIRETYPIRRIHPTG